MNPRLAETNRDGQPSSLCKGFFPLICSTSRTKSSLIWYSFVKERETYGNALSNSTCPWSDTAAHSVQSGLGSDILLHN